MKNITMRFSAISFAILLLCFATTSVQATTNKPPPDDLDAVLSKGPMEIGTHHSIRISSDVEKSDIKPRISGNNARQVYILRHRGASYLSVHFSLLDLDPSCSMEIADDDGEQHSLLKGRGRHNQGNFWARHVVGDRMKITLKCNVKKDHKAIFDIDDYVAGFPELAPEMDNERRLRQMHSRGQQDTTTTTMRHPFGEERDLSICNEDNRENAVCYRDSYPTVYQKSRAVARLHINGSGGCTGWLVGPNNMLLTNEHCITSANDARNTDFEFNAEETTCLATNGNCWFCKSGEIFDGLDLLAYNESLDFALIQLSGNPAEKYGYLELDNREAIVDEQIYIPQHPSGRAKEIALEDTDETEDICRVLTTSNGSCRGSYDAVKYKCDTEGGSSGSPVIARSSHKVIALHNCGGACNGNQGVPVTKFYDIVAPYLEDTPDVVDPIECGSDKRFELTLKTDEYGQETTWEISGTSGRVVASGPESGEYLSSRTNNIVVCLPAGSYTFTIFDKADDGICCGYGSGSYEVVFDGVSVKSGGDFGSTQSVIFGSGISCENDGSWRFLQKSGKKKRCRWVGNKPNWRCRQVGMDGRTGSDACPTACQAECQ